MVIQLEIRKIEKTFGKNRWEIRIGDIEGSIVSHNISKTELLQDIRNEMKKEEKKENEKEKKQK